MVTVVCTVRIPKALRWTVHNRCSMSGLSGPSLAKRCPEVQQRPLPLVRVHEDAAQRISVRRRCCQIQLSKSIVPYAGSAVADTSATRTVGMIRTQNPLFQDRTSGLLLDGPRNGRLPASVLGAPVSEDRRRRPPPRHAHSRRTPPPTRSDPRISQQLVHALDESRLRVCSASCIFSTGSVSAAQMVSGCNSPPRWF
jgi:hypothetical protein